jgi:ribosome maturation factor RimP
MEKSFKTRISDTLRPLATGFAEPLGLVVLRIEVRGTEQQPVIEVILDGERAVQIADCEQVSKSLHEAIDSDTLVKGNYRLDVLSPGIDEPIMEDFQLKRNMGRLVEVQYRDGEEHHTLHGRLRDFSDKEVVIQPIHPKSSTKPSKSVVTEAGQVQIEDDEQIYDDPVELVKIERKHVSRLVAQVDFGR